MAASEIASTDVNTTESSYNNEAGATMNESVDENRAVDQSVAAQETTTVQMVEQPTEAVKPEDQRLSASSELLEMDSQERETEDHPSTGSAFHAGFDAAAAAAAAVEDHSLCTETSGMDFPPNQQPEMRTQADPAASEMITSAEPEMVVNSDEVPVPAQQTSAGSTTNEQFCASSTPEAESERHEMIDQVDSKFDVLSSLSAQSTFEHEAPAAQATQHLPLSGLDGSSVSSEMSEEQPCVAEQPVRSQPDEALVGPVPQTDEVEPTSTTLCNNTLESCSEETITGVSAMSEEQAIHHAGEEQPRAAATDSTLPDQSGGCDEPSAIASFDHEQRSACSSQRSGTETDVHSIKVEPSTFAFPGPPRHPYKPLAVGDDGTDDVFVDHSSPRNDRAASDEILPATAMTSSTTSAAADASDVGRQEQPLGDESVLADAVPAALQPQNEEEEVILARSPTAGGRSHETQIPPTLEAATAAATAPEPAKDGERAGENAGDEIRADEPPADRTVDKLKTSSSEPCSSSGDLLTATQSTDAADQQPVEEPDQQSDQQQISCSADRRQLSLLIPGHDLDLYVSDNQVSVCIQSSKIVRAR